ncbi:MAG: hypothetical protein AAF614_36390 [Chloroflexota bacterium]
MKLFDQHMQAKYNEKRGSKTKAPQLNGTTASSKATKQQAAKNARRQRHMDSALGLPSQHRQS